MEFAVVHSSYFPPISQFSLMVSNPCTFEVFDNYQKQTYRNRMYIYGANGKQMLSVPVKHTKTGEGHQLFKDVRVDNSFPWQKQHWKTLQTAYRTSPYFEYYEDMIRPVFETGFSFLLDVNIASIEAVLSCLREHIHFSKTTQYESTPQAGIDFRLLTDAKREFAFSFPLYYQIFSDKHGFLPNLSVLDLLFHKGPETLSYLAEASQEVWKINSASN